MCYMASFFVSLFSFDWLNYSATFAATLIAELIFVWLLSPLYLQIGLLCILCSNVLQYWLSLLYMLFQFVTGLFLLLSFLYIIIFIIVICYHLYAWYLQLHTSNKSRFWSIYCCRYSVITVYGACGAVLRDKRFLLWH